MLLPPRQRLLSMSFRSVEPSVNIFRSVGMDLMHNCQYSLFLEA